MTEHGLERIFRRAEQMPAGKCYFPEPGRDLKAAVDHPLFTGLTNRRVEHELEIDEKKRFRKLIIDSLGEEGMSEEVVKRMLKLW